MRAVTLGALAAFTLFASPGPARPPAPTPVTCMLMSDVHFDPLADMSLLPQLMAQDISQWDAIFQTSTQTAFSAYGSDSNYALMTSAFAQVGSQSSNGLLIYTGDLLRHRFDKAFETGGRTEKQYQEFATKTAVFTVQKLQQAGKVPVVIALGNNDSTEGDYVLTPNSPFLAALAKTIDVVANAQDADVRKDFEYGGFYAIPNPSVPSQDLIVLNTVYWSGSYHQSLDPGDTELNWLGGKLKTAQAGHRHVSLVMHIPPGLDAFTSQQDQTPTLLWKEKYETAFLALMAQYSDTVVVSFAGHTHMDDFRVLPDTNSKPFLPLRTTPAVSPAFDNNPGFAVFTYNPSGNDIKEVTTFFLNLTDATPIWKPEYQFSKAYGFKAYNAANLSVLAARIRKQGKEFGNYQTFYDVSAAPSPVTPSTWTYYSCAETTFTTSDYAGCLAANAKTTRK